MISAIVHLVSLDALENITRLVVKNDTKVAFYLINTFEKIQAEGYNVISTVYGSLLYL